MLSADLQAVVTDAFTAVATDVVSIVKIGLPIGLGIMGLFLAIRLGIGFFKSVAH